MSAPFDIEDCGHGLWCLRPQLQRAKSVYVRGSLPVAQLSKSTRVEIEWPDGGGAVVKLGLPSGSLSVPVASAFALEALPALYDALPLGRVDGRSRRFWGRVFSLVRLPGGRFLLGWLARRNRRSN